VLALLLSVLACADCHKELAARFARTPMANTSGNVRPEEEAPGKVADLYTITPRLNLQWPGGSVQLTFFIGSRRIIGKREQGGNRSRAQLTNETSGRYRFPALHLPIPWMCAS